MQISAWFDFKQNWRNFMKLACIITLMVINTVSPSWVQGNPLPCTLNMPGHIQTVDCMLQGLWAEKKYDTKDIAGWISIHSEINSTKAEHLGIFSSVIWTIMVSCTEVRLHLILFKDTFLNLRWVFISRLQYWEFKYRTTVQNGKKKKKKFV